VAVEPDPACIEILNNQSTNYPNLIIVHGALASTESVALYSVDGFGSSASSVLGIGNGECIAVKGHKMDDIMRSVGRPPVFVKIDIEGFECILIEEIKELLNYNLRGLQLAVHPQLYEKSLCGNWFSRRWRSFVGTSKIANTFHRFSPYPTVTGYRSLLSYLIIGILLNFKPKGTDLIFERASFPQ
jgi:FkbM family methyltransferase